MEPRKYATERWAARIANRMNERAPTRTELGRTFRQTFAACQHPYAWCFAVKVTDEIGRVSYLGKGKLP
jgi:hypothetical protein